MIDQLIQFDERLFFAINNGMSNGFFDWVMPLLRNRFIWAPLYLFVIIFCARNYGKRGYIIIGFLLLTFAITDMFSSHFIKPSVHRLRPCNNIELKTQVVSRIACGTGYSFPSSHAANHFAIATFLVLLFYRRWKWIAPLAISWAFLISFAQVYVGVHYPLDVTTGAIIGTMIGYITGSVFLVLQPEKRWNPGS